MIPFGAWARRPSANKTQGSISPWGKEERKAFLDGVAAKHNIKAPGGWRRISRDQLRKMGGGPLLRQFPSFYHLLCDYYEEDFLFQCRTRFARGIWDDRDSRRAFLDQAAAYLGLQKPQHWLKVTYADLFELGAAGLMGRYSSICHMLADSYPEHSELFMANARKSPTRGSQLQSWKNAEQRRAFMDGLAQKLDITDAEGWKRVTAAAVAKAGGKGLLAHYPSVLAMLQDIYPEKGICLENSRPQAPRGHWNCRENQRAVLDAVAERHGVACPEDWKRIRVKDVRAEKGGASLLKKYRSLADALQTLYGDDGIEWHARSTPAEHWADEGNREAFFSKLGTDAGIQLPEEWKKVTRHLICQHGGSGLLRRYQSVQECMIDVFPSIRLQLFGSKTRLPSRFWQQSDNVRAFVSLAEKELQIRDKEEWGRVSIEQVKSLKGGSILTHLSLSDVLKTAYPGEQWPERLCTDRLARKKSNQRMLLLCLQGVFHGSEVSYSKLL